MKKPLRLILMVILPLALLISCEEEDLINGGSKSTSNPTTTTPTTGTTPTSTKCYIKDVLEVIDGQTYKSAYTFNAKNLLEKVDNDGAITTYSYDVNNRITTIAIVDGVAVETFTYSYDSKGNITTIKYVAKNTPIDIFIKQYNLTSNANGQITKIVAVTDDGNLEFTLEYDAKSNLKKIIMVEDGLKQTLFENLTFDDKTNVYANTGLSKVNIPFVLIGAFFGENLSNFMNTNNVLTDSRVQGLSPDKITTTYKYEYAKEGQPSKMSFTEIQGNQKTTGSSTFTYNCK
jgi:YD repeat-containing protein